MGEDLIVRPDSHTDLAWQELASGVRLVATDLDGTLLRPGGDVSEFTVSTLARARAEGLPVVFVTGRPPRWLPEIVEQTDHRTLAVSANGALILDLATEEVLVTRPLDPAVIDAVVDLLRAEGVDTISYFQVDNPLVRCVDPAFLGWHLSRGAEMSAKMVPKAYAEEKVGMFCTQRGKTVVEVLPEAAS